MIDLGVAARYVSNRLEAGALTHEDVARLVAEAQRALGLEVDGMPGPATLAAIRPPAPRATVGKVYPLPLLPDMRRPYITSGFKSRNPSRPNHNGADLFYRWRKEDGPQRLGDGGATRDPATPGDAKWFIPAGTMAIAAAAGVVTEAGPHTTGHRVWIDHTDGHRTGYFHLRSVRVTAGQVVSAGHPLGEVGDNPIDRDAEHLHFEVSPVGRYAPIDPEVWLAGASFFTVA